MKKRIIILIFCAVSIASLPLMAQKMMPYNFKYETDSLDQESLKILTEVKAPSSSFLRLFFKDTQLGKESYLLLEATDGAKQKLGHQEIENWSYSSAYFNGSTVKVSLFTASGEKNKITINEIKADDGNKINANGHDQGARKKLVNQTVPSSNSEDISTKLPHATAVGRFTNGNDSYGTGWIAPNGAIVTTRGNVERARNGGYDVIEFNVPPSDGFGTVNHPDPEDQYLTRNKWEGSFGIFDFKRKYKFDAKDEDGYNEFYNDWGIIDVWPNSTGFKPGERLEHYFQVARNPGSFTLKSHDVLVDVLHYGETNSDNFDGGNGYRTLKRHITNLVQQKEYLSTKDPDRFVVYNEHEGNITLSNSDTGAPITYNNSNIAIGVHFDFLKYPPSVAVGFREDKFLSALDNFIFPNTVFVDQESYWNSSTGAIDKPYFEISEGINNAKNNDVISIARGSYNETMYISKAVTLRAPVGKVVIGKSDIAARRGKTTIPEAYFKDDDDSYVEIGLEAKPDFNGFKSYPNPFIDFTEVHYSLTETTKVDLKVFDILGNEVSIMVQESQAPGFHSVIWDGNSSKGRKALPGLYIIRLQAGAQSSTVKVIKN